MAVKNEKLYLYDCANCFRDPKTYPISLTSFKVKEERMAEFLLTVPRLTIPGGPLCNDCWDEIVEGSDLDLNELYNDLWIKSLTLLMEDL